MTRSPVVAVVTHPRDRHTSGKFPGFETIINCLILQLYLWGYLSYRIPTIEACVSRNRRRSFREACADPIGKPVSTEMS